MKKSFLLFSYIFIVAFTFFLYYSVNISPDVHWAFAFLPLLIPFFLLLHLAMALVFLIKREYILLAAALLMLGLGYKYFHRTFNFGFGNYLTKNEGISLLSYNVRVFNNYKHLSQKGKAAKAIIEFAENKPASIKCFQEFYYKKGSDLYNTIKKMSRKTPYFYFEPSVKVHNIEEYGLAIFSKYPIIKKGEIPFPKQTYNQAIFADLLIDQDTLRVYNVHLQSMSINENRLPEAENTTENKGRIKELYRKIRNGATIRAGQVKAILDHMENCTHPIIIAGDFNDTPYSHTYEKLREKLNNAFEEKGFGFGFTYNGRLFFLRIDNIFSEDRINIHSFKTLNKVRFSDHFPVEFTFSMEP